MGRKEKKYHYIYKTINTLSGKYYIGMHSTDNLEDGYLGSGTRLRHSINKYGKENHKREIVEYCKSREELKNRESEIVSLNEIAKIDCMNLKVGGYGGLSDDEHYKNFTKAGIDNFNRTKVQREKSLMKVKKTDDYKEKLIKGVRKYYENNPSTFKGKTHSEESKQLISETMRGKGKGETNSQYGTCWITKDGENKKIKKEDLDKWLGQGWNKGRK